MPDVKLPGCLRNIYIIRREAEEEESEKEGKEEEEEDLRIPQREEGEACCRIERASKRGLPHRPTYHIGSTVRPSVRRTHTRRVCGAASPLPLPPTVRPSVQRAPGLPADQAEALLQLTPYYTQRMHGKTKCSTGRPRRRRRRPTWLGGSVSPSGDGGGGGFDATPTPRTTDPPM